MKILVAAIALAFAVPAAAQTAPAAQPHQGHQPGQHQPGQHQPGQHQHGQHEHAQHRHGEHGDGRHAYCERGQDGRMAECCAKAAEGQRPACCAKAEGRHAKH